MKKHTDVLQTSIVLLIGAVIFLASCSNELVVKTDYPEQLLYLPAAVSGIFTISSIVPVGNTKYIVDAQNNKLTIPLGVSRSGVKLDGDFSADIKANSDTVSKMISVSTLTGTDLLPAGKYTLPASVNGADGANNAPFTLELDLDFLRNNTTKKYAIGVSIASSQRKANPKLSTAIIVIDSKFLKPTADFTAKADATLSKKVVFTNASTNALTYSWDFGDGSTVSTVAAPTYTYTMAGTYTVTLTATGVTGSLDAIKKTQTITVL